MPQQDDDYMSSLGEFVGDYNINQKHFAKVRGSGTWERKVLIGRGFTSSLTATEDASVKVCFLDLLARHSIGKFSNYELIQFQWPTRLCAVEPYIVDRTVRAWFSTAEGISFQLLENIKTFLATIEPAWRAVLHFPCGEDADCVVYDRGIRIGDGPTSSETVLEMKRREWLVTEKRHLAIPSEQFRLLEGKLPICYVDRNCSIFMMGILSGCFSDPMKQLDTLWIGQCGTQLESQPHVIRHVKMNGSQVMQCDYRLFGTLTSEGVWQFSRHLEAKGQLESYQLDRGAKLEHLALNGTEESTGESWGYEIDGKDFM